MSMVPFRFSVPALLLPLVVACDQSERGRTTLHAAPGAVSPSDGGATARARQDSINRATAGYVVDSILPIEEHLRRFRADLTAVDSFRDGFSSPEALIRAIVAGVERADTAALVRAAITRAEFAWLVYPPSPYTRPPMRQAPEIVWYLQAGSSDQGLNRLLDRLGGSSLGFGGFSCDDPVRQGPNTLLPGCVVTQGGQAQGRRLFGTLIGRDGQWKVLSYANDY